jgi:hypothetical protein
MVSKLDLIAVAVALSALDRASTPQFRGCTHQGRVVRTPRKRRWRQACILGRV